MNKRGGEENKKNTIIGYCEEGSKQNVKEEEEKEEEDGVVVYKARFDFVYPSLSRSISISI